MANNKATRSWLGTALKDSQNSGRRHGSGVFLLEGQRDRAGGVLR